jgi:hypothetical protein
MEIFERQQTDKDRKLELASRHQKISTLHKNKESSA